MMVMRTPRGSLRKQEKMFADGSGKKESTPMKQFHSGELSRLPISGSGKKRSAIPLKECSSVLRKIEPLAPVLKSRRHNEDIRRVTALADERRSSGATNTSQIMSASNRLHVNGSKMYERDDFEGFDANEEEQELDKGTLTSILKIGKPPECVRDAMLALACLFAGFDSRISMDILDDPDIRWPELRAMLVDAPSFCRKDNLKALSAIGWPALTTMQVVGTILKSYELKLKTEISMYCELTEQVVDFIKAALKHAGKRVKKPRNQKNEPPLTTLHDDNYDVEEATDCQVNEEGKGYNEVYVEPPPPTEKFKLIQVQCESFNYQERQDEWKGADVFQARENSHRQSEDRWKEGRTSSLTPRLSERQSISHLKMKYEGGKYSSPKSTNVSERINTLQTEVGQGKDNVIQQSLKIDCPVREDFEPQFVTFGRPGKRVAQAPPTAALTLSNMSTPQDESAALPLASPNLQTGDIFPTDQQFDRSFGSTFAAGFGMFFEPIRKKKTLQ